jgi:hypothetical protein
MYNHGVDDIDRKDTVAPPVTAAAGQTFIIARAGGCLSVSGWPSDACVLAESEGHDRRLFRYCARC